MARLTPKCQESIKSLLVTLHFLFPHEMIPALDLLDRGLVCRMVIMSSLHSAEGSESGTGSAAAAVAPGGGIDSATDTHTGASSEDDDDRPGADSYKGGTIPKYLRKEVDKGEIEIFYVQSASSLQSSTTIHRHSRHQNTTHRSTTYEVRLEAWNCTCPAFAFSTFGGRSFTPLDNHDAEEQHLGMQHLDEHSTDYETEETVVEDQAETAGVDDGGNVAAQWTFGGTLTLPSSNLASPVPVCKHILAAVLGKHVPGFFGSGSVQASTVSREEAAGWAGGWGD
jgi:SWIM zinc finger